MPPMRRCATGLGFEEVSGCDAATGSTATRSVFISKTTFPYWRRTGRPTGGRRRAIGTNKRAELGPSQPLCRDWAARSRATRCHSSAIACYREGRSHLSPRSTGTNPGRSRRGAIYATATPRKLVRQICANFGRMIAAAYTARSALWWIAIGQSPAADERVIGGNSDRTSLGLIPRIRAQARCRLRALRLRFPRGTPSRRRPKSPPTSCRAPRPRRSCRASSTTCRSGSEDSLRANPPRPPGGRAE